MLLRIEALLAEKEDGGYNRLFTSTSVIEDGREQPTADYAAYRTGA